MAAFKLNLADLVFVLRQIKIAEANSSGTPLTEIWVDIDGNVVPPGTEGAILAIASPMAPFGLRTVDGSNNNIVPGRELWGAADQPMPRLLPSYYRNEGDDAPFFGVTNNNYAVNRDPVDGVPSGNVVDTDPRLISNLVSDMSFNNPAAIVAALSFAEFNGAFAGEIYGPGGALETIQDAFADLRAVLDNPHTSDQADAANEAFDAVLAGFGVEHNGSSISIPNIAPDEGLSVPFNAWMTFFGQFFDHGLDLINKGGNGTVYVPLLADDPLMTHGADGIAGTGDELSLPQNSHLAFMALTRATPSGESEINQTTPFVDQNQTYTSNASHQAFLREYKLVDPDDTGPLAGRPLATGHLLDGSDGNDVKSSLPTWADVKAQALSMLGIQLTDLDVGNIPVLRMDPYGEFVRGPNGMPQILAGVDSNGNSIWVETSLTSPINPSAIQLPVGTVLFGGNVIEDGETVSAVRTGHAFLDDIAHTAVPGTVFDHDNDPLTAAIVVQADGDNLVGNSIATDSQGRKVAYDNELLDQHYITGDGRGNENIGLTAVHHVFHAEHNRQVEQQQRTILEGGDLAFLNEWLLTDITQEQYDAVAGKTPLELNDFAATLSWDGERLFQSARMATEMQYQHLVFEEFARKIQPAIDPFVFNTAPDIDPSIFAEFAHVVYRFGHSMLTDNMPRINGQGLEVPGMKADGTTMDAEEFGLVASFLNPLAFDNNGSLTDDQGAAAVIRGMTIERGNEIDEFLVDALRNNLLGLPLDLGAINIARGRDTGMPSLNQAREALFNASGSTFLEPYANWVDFAANLKHPVSVVNFIAAYGTHLSITSATTADAKRDAAWNLVMGGSSDPIFADRMEFLTATGAYTDKGGLNEIDLWIGGLAEKKMPFGGFLGSTFNAVFELQLENLQDGDRFYYLTRTQGQNFLNALEQNSFAKMMMANTSLAQPGADGIRGTADDIIERHIGVDSFGVYDYVLEVNVDNQVDYNTASPEAIAAATQALDEAQDAHDAAVASSDAADQTAADAAAALAAAQAAATADAITLRADANAAQAQAAALNTTAELGLLLTTLVAANAPGADASAQAALMAALNGYVTALAADQAADAAAASTDALADAAEAADAVEAAALAAATAANSAAATAAAAEAAALAALTQAQADLAEASVNPAGKDPVGNNPVLEAAGLGKVIRDDLSTPGADANYIRVQGGEHVVVGGTNGNDTIITDFGDDGIWGGDGDDRIESGAGVDLVNGGGGNDIITDSGDTGDFLKGDEGDDVIANSNGLDILMGGTGKDVFFVGVDDTEVFAGEGDDFILGGAGVDFLLGNEGDDWMEGGAGFDTTAGDNSELFFDSRIIGHDVMFSGTDEHDFDAESGDDIMVQGESVIRNEGMFGFDWATYKGNSKAADADLGVPIFTTEVQDILRNRFDKVEGLSGWDQNDVLTGDDRGLSDNVLGVVNATAEGVFFRDEINAEGIARIAGLEEVITAEQMFDGIYGSDFSDNVQSIFSGGNVILGGGGSDTITGKGGNDIIDGDRWLNVRIRITEAGEANDPLNQIATIDSLSHKFADDFSIVAWQGKSVFELMLDRTIVPNQLHIVREIVKDDGVGDTDVAVFWDIIDNYTFSVASDGALVVNHSGFDPANLPVDGGFRVSDGIDTLRNIERVRFGDGNGGTVEVPIAFVTPQPATGQVILSDLTPTEGQAVTFDASSVADANGLGPFTFQWQQSADGENWTNIANATNATFTPVDLPGSVFGPQAGQQLRVVVSFTDGRGYLETITSDASGPTGVNWTAQPLVTNLFNGTAGDDIAIAPGGAFGGNDALNGGGGNDLLDGGSGNDSLNGEAGDDTLFGGAGADTLLGGTGNDTLNGNEGNDFLSGEDGDDLLRGQAGDDILTGGVGNDTLFGNGGVDTLFGGEGDDNLFGGTGNDTLNGNAGNDSLDGEAGDDLLLGQAGDDILTGGAGNDTIAGNGGTDTVVYTGGLGNFRVETTASQILLTDTVGNEGIDTLAADIEVLRFQGTAYTTIFGGAGGQTLNGNGQSNALFGFAGNDTLNGAGSSDILHGGAGNDTINGGGGADFIYQTGATDGRDLVNGGAGTDTYILQGVAAPETFRIYTLNAALAAGMTGFAAGTEIVITRNGTNNASIIAELDSIEEIRINSLLHTSPGGSGQTNADGDTVAVFGDFTETSLDYNTIRIAGGVGNDTIDITNLSSAHRVVFDSNGGADTVIGQLRPQDVINGDGVVDLRAGADVLTGASGADVFRFGDGDSIADFVSGEDKMDLGALGVTAGNLWEAVSVNQAGSDAWVSVGSARMHLTGVNANDLDLTNFILEAAAAAEAGQASAEASITMVRDLVELAPLEMAPMELNRYSGESLLTGPHQQFDILYRSMLAGYSVDLH